MYTRLAERSDIPQLIPLLQYIDRLHLEWHPDIFRAAKRSPHSVMELLKTPSRQLWVAAEDGILLGLMELEFRTRTGSFVHAKEFVLLDMLVVKEGAQNQGVGEMLVNKAKELVQEQKQSHLELKVYSANEKAASYYQKLGFRPVWQQLSWQPEGSGK